jgi:hypothetical protein
MNIGTEFTELAATIGSKKDGDEETTTKPKNEVFLTPKQWALVVLASAVLIGVLDFWINHIGM